MAGAKKSTKKFEKNHLKDVIERRKSHAKVKQRHQLNDKRKEKNATKRAEAEEANEISPEEAKKQNAFAEMNVDDFFAGGFEIPEANGKKSKKDVTPKIGKRKRSEDKAQAEEAPEEGDNDEEDASSVDGYDEHKEQLESLKEKDPEFYKYLKENDAELLDFGEQGDLSEVDALSESEPEDEQPAKKKKKSKKDEEEEAEPESTTLTIQTVKKWHKLMEEQNSIRAMRQVVLAFRAAAHVNDADAPEQTRF
jgi:nucleolar complex protein 2